MGKYELPLARRLRDLSEQMIEAAEEISRNAATPRMRPAFLARDQESARSLAAAKDLYHQRLRRRAHFPMDLFGEPAWDMLLDLFIAAEEGRRISVTSACLGAQVPLTTALRWLQQLEAEGLVVRHQDHQDGRRRVVRISAEGHARMAAYLGDQRADDRPSFTPEPPLGSLAVERRHVHT